MTRPLRIRWILSSLQFTGGLRVVYEHSRQLLARGHDVTLVAPRTRMPLPFGRAGLRAWNALLLERFVLRSERMLDHYDLRERLHVVPALEPAHLPDADVTLATDWRTTEVVAQRPTRAGRGAYFIQHYEVFEPGLESAVDAAWRRPLVRVVIASWLGRLAAERFGLPAHGPVVNGVDLDAFHPGDRRENDPPVIGMLYETMPWKGFADGYAAVGIARRAHPGLRLRLYGRPRLRIRLAPGDTFDRSPTPTRLSALYRECDFFLSPSWTEGCGLPPMEAMASGCAVVSTDTGGIADYAVPGTTALVAPPRDVDGLAAHLVRLAGDRAYARRLAAAGHAHIRAFTWSRATDALEAILRDVDAGNAT